MKERNNKIKVYDAIMGSGKTHKAIERMKKYVEKDVKFIYITPFLDEITRVKNELPENSVFEPLNAKVELKTNYKVKRLIDVNNPKKSIKVLNKREHLLKLVSKKENILATHSLFKKLKIEDYSMFKDYILILDEVIEPLEIRNVGAEDIQIMLEQNLIIIDEETREVRFIKDNYHDNAFKKIKEYCYSNTVFHLDESFFVWIFPIEIFKEFKEIQILTYLFNASFLSAYFKMNDMEYDIISSNSIGELSKIKELLNIYIPKEKDKKYKITRYSKTWCENLSNRSVNKITNSTSYIFKNKFKTKSTENAYTTFKKVKDKLKGNSYSKNFIAVNARATNDYRNIKSMAYLANRYFIPQQKSFFKERGINLNEDLWALSELVQWIWRGCIRDGKKMNLYIPSYRMISLLIRWLDGEFLTENSVEIKNEKVA